MRFLTTVALAVVLTLPAMGAVTLNNDGKGALTVSEEGEPVFVYRYGTVTPPDGVPAKYARESYIHPLYGLDGEVLTQDFPDDHYHHRGVFWAWPHCFVGDRKLNVWEMDGARPVFEDWVLREETDHYARFGVQNNWTYDENNEPSVRERVFVTVHPRDAEGRSIDFHLQFQNISQKTVTVRGATTDNKGYGGFGVRPDKAFVPLHFTAITGTLDEDALELQTPWVAVHYGAGKDGAMAGYAILQHPANPGYPHKGWLVRHYGYLGASWPWNDTHTLAPGEYFELQYRLQIFSGTAEEAGIAKTAERYKESNR